MSKLKYYIEQLKASFWFLPLIIMIASVCLAVATIAYDKQVDYVPEGIFQYLFSGSADSARNILSTIAGAMVGVAGTVFSITLVALTLASSQFGSRLLRNFMYDRMNQIVLGTYISNFIYCLIVLNAVEGTEEFSFIPVISVFTAIIITLANLFLLVIFIHHIAISIQSDKVISDISTAIEKNIERLFPKNLGEAKLPPNKKNTAELYVENKVIKIVKATNAGYIQSIDSNALFEVAKEYDLIIWVKYRPGDYVVAAVELVEIFSNLNYDNEIKERISNVFIIGKTRTTLQDTEFSIHQMVEIAVRALSPGVNDPYTAISCIDNLSAAMCYLIKKEFPSKFRYDENEKLRVIADNITFENALNISFGQIRHYAEGSPSVILKLITALKLIHKFTKTETQEKVILQHAKMVYNLAEKSFVEAYDLKEIETIYKELVG